LAGDTAFVDYSGKGVPIVDPATGEVRLAEIFVTVLGASPRAINQAGSSLYVWVISTRKLPRIGRWRWTTSRRSIGNVIVELAGFLVSVAYSSGSVVNSNG
jgi:transposase